MASLDEFKEVLHQLVAKVPEVENELSYLSPGRVGHSKAEEQTKNRLIVPFLDALGFDADHRTPEAAMRRSGMGQLIWVDYVLKREPTDRKGLALLEAKSLLRRRPLEKTQKANP